MGFWGTFVVHRGERLLAECLPELAAFGDAELCYDNVAGGWQVTRVFARRHDLPTSFLADLRDATGAPVLAAQVFDSDAAFVRALGRGTSGWQAWLDLDMALAYLVPPPAPFAEDGTYLGDDWSDPDYEREVIAVKQQILAEAPRGLTAAAAVAWAAEAGLEAGSIEEVAEVLNGHELFVEDLFFTLLNRLGLDTDEAEVPAPPTVPSVLRSLFGHRLRAVGMTLHEPARGDHVFFPNVQDMRWHFDNQPTVRACGCTGNFRLLASAANDLSSNGSGTERSGESAPDAILDVIGQRLTDAAIVRHRYLPDVKGVVLRFGHRDLFVVALNGRWTVAKGSTIPEELMNEYGPHRRDGLKMNAWLTSVTTTDGNGGQAEA